MLASERCHGGAPWAHDALIYIIIFVLKPLPLREARDSHARSPQPQLGRNVLPPMAQHTTVASVSRAPSRASGCMIDHLGGAGVPAAVAAEDGWFV